MSEDEEDFFAMGAPHDVVACIASWIGCTSFRYIGGGLGLSVARRGKAGKLSIIVVKEKDVGSVLCGGRIGSGGSMCVRTKRQCTVATHKMKATFETANASQSGHYVVVAANG